MNGDSQQQGIFVKVVTWLFGASWKTSASGYATMIALAIHEKPQLIAWIPEPEKGVIWNLSEYLFFGGFLVMANRMKDKTITGGTVQQTASGATAAPGTQALVDETIKATLRSGEPVTDEQKKAIQ